MSTVLLVIDDGRGHLAGCWESVHRHLVGWDRLVVVDDSRHELGFAGAVEQGWARIREMVPEPKFVFHLESDFRFVERVPLFQMRSLLVRNAWLAQVSLKRQAVNDRERAAGGLVEANPDDFLELHDSAGVWTEHRRYFTTNPSLYPVAMCHLGWPQTAHSEGTFTAMLRRTYPTLSFALWGRKFDPPRVEHVGHVRAGHGY